MQRQYILAATKYPRRLCRSRQNFLGYFVAATESPSDKINCDTGPPFDSHEMEEFHLSDNGPPFDSHKMEEVIARYTCV